MVQGEVDEILGDENIIEIKSADLLALQNALQQFPGNLEIEKEMDSLIVTMPTEISNQDINQYLFEKGIVLSHLSSRKKNLEMQFLEITNK